MRWLPPLSESYVLSGAMMARAKEDDMLQGLLREQPACIVAMEGMRGQPFLGRFAKAHGHDVRLIPPICVKPFVKRQKNDAANAAAIAEAALRSNMHYVAVKSTGEDFRWFNSSAQPLAA